MKFWMPSKLQSRGFCRKNEGMIRAVGAQRRAPQAERLNGEYTLVNIDPAELAGFEGLDALIGAMEVILVASADFFHQRGPHEQHRQAADDVHDAIGTERGQKGP